MRTHSTESLFLRFWNWLTFTEQRLRQLKDSGHTVGLQELNPQPDEHILEIDLGYGREYWLAPMGLVQMQKHPIRLKDGRLVLDGDHPLSTDAPLRQRDLSIQFQARGKFR